MELKQFIGFKCKTAKIQDGLAGCAIFFLYKPAKMPILNEISLGVISIYGSKKKKVDQKIRAFAVNLCRGCDVK